jgi:hypothetical protein
MKKIVIIVLIVLIPVIAYAVSITVGSGLTVVNVTMKQTDNGNFALAVSNQSFKTRLVDITIHIDDKLALQGIFDVANQHNFQQFQFSLPNGTHKINVESIIGGAKLEKEFEITSKQYVGIFCCDDSTFGFSIYNKRIGFQ